MDPSLGPNDGDPDNTCSFCIDVNDGRALDLIEMDAASHRGIDDVRSLQERVFGAGPSRGRAKVYIIDEVHMLTDFAFNALLKTLEEPAPWAYFVLCTTEPHKVLATIISRCQRFDFRRIAPRDVQARLQTVCEGEGYTCEPEALMAIARATGGSARDALNILEQTALSYGNTVPLSRRGGAAGPEPRPSRAGAGAARPWRQPEGIASRDDRRGLRRPRARPIPPGGRRAAARRAPAEVGRRRR